MKKRIFFCVLSLFILLSCISCGSQSDFYKVDPESTHAFIYDYNDGSLRKFNYAENEIVYPASITKLLTALVSLDTLPADTIITPGNEVYMSPEGASSAYIRPHHQLTLEMLIEGMMLPSGNDAAYAVAAACGRAISGEASLEYTEAVEVFVYRMNEYAAELGCVNTSFTTPDGFAGNEHYSTLDDMILICSAAAENPLITKYAAMQSDDVVYASGHTNTWVNTNLMLSPKSKYYNEHIIGLKTGSLEDNYSLAALFDDGKNRFLIGVFGANRENERYEDVSALIETEILINENAEAGK